MPVSLTLIPANATISASTLRARLLTLQRYVNEEAEATDRGSAWCSANHIYRPDFYGSPDPHSTMVSGENYFRQRSVDPDYRTFFSHYMGEGPYLIPGLSATIQVPESLNQGTYYYRLNVFASFYVYEFGGNDDTLDETYLTATVHLGTTTLPTSIRDHTVRELFKGSQTYTLDNVAIYPRKQHSLMWAFAGNVNGLTTPGVQSLGLWVKLFEPPGVGTADPEWKHIIFQQANLIARYRIR